MAYHMPSLAIEERSSFALLEKLANSLL